MTQLTRRAALVLATTAVLLAGCTPQSESADQAEPSPEPEVALSMAEQNLADGIAFLAEVSEKDGVVQTNSGRMYEVLTEGEGEKPNGMSTVTVHYEGTFPGGDVFDSSYARGQTISFPLNQVISGWTEGLQLMSPGSKYKFYIPMDLAYGPNGRSGIPPNQALVFVVELFSFE
jgi:FKBP-type peptidyl-prolyl cis-trans isomerase FkpA